MAVRVFRRWVVMLATLAVAWPVVAQSLPSDSDGWNVQGKLADLIGHVGDDLSEDRVVEVDRDAIPDFSGMFEHDAFEGGRHYLYLFRCKAPVEAVWEILKDYESQDTFPGTPVKAVEKLEEGDGEIVYRTDTDTALGTKTQFTRATVCEDSRVVCWRADPDKDNSVEHTNGFWAVHDRGEGELVVACYTHLSIGWLKDKWAKGTQRRLAEATKAAVEHLCADMDDEGAAAAE